MRGAQVIFVIMSLVQVTALHFAAREGAIASAVSLLEAGARVDAMDEQGATPLSLAVQSKREAMVALLRQSRT